MNARMVFLFMMGLVTLSAELSGQDLEFLRKRAEGQVRVHRDHAGQADADGWFNAKSTDGHFRVRLPDPFIDYTENKPGEKAGTLQKSFVIQSAKPSTVFCSVTETPAGEPLPPARMIQEGTRDVLVETVTKMGEDPRHGVVYGVRKFEFNGFPAAEVRILRNGRVRIMRSIYLPDRTCFLTAEYMNESHAKSGPQATKFLDSFQLDPDEHANYGSPEEEQRLLLEWAFKLPLPAKSEANAESGQRR